MELPGQIALGWAAVALLLSAFWLYARAVRNATIVDLGWTLGVGLIAVLGAATGQGPWRPRVLVACLTGLWALRLAWHLYRDRLRGQPEDGRYQALRARWGALANTWFFWFFQAQAFLAALFALPALLAMSRPGPDWRLSDGLGTAIWLAAVLGESLADWQLARFRHAPQNRGRTCRAGLWKYSRHPNYFFEWLHWWAYVAIAWPADWGWTAAFAPLLMLYFLFKVTGIPATEAQALTSRGDDYREYQRTTSAFFPWFPRPLPPRADETPPLPGAAPS